MIGLKNVLRKSYKDICVVVGLFVMVTLLLFYFMDLGQCDLSVPFSYAGGDELSIINTARMVQESGWNTGTDRLSATDDYYYNNNEIISGLHTADIVLVKFFLIVSGNNAVVAANLTYLAIFYLTTLVTYIVMRLLGIKKWLSGAGALVFAFLAFVFMRGIGHIGLSSYYFVPLAVLMAIWVYEDEKFMLPGKGFFKYKRNIGGMVMALLVASQGLGYWQVFGCFVIMVSALSAFIKTKDKMYLIRGALSTAAIVVAVIVCCIPVFISMAAGGRMASSGRARYGTEGEAYGLKIVQLFLPVNGHGIDFWQECLDLYNQNMPLVNENRSAYLGLFGIVGFIILICWLLTNKKDDTVFRKRITVLSDMNICAVILATIGGVGSMLYLAGINILRSYNRISVYIAFISILAACLVVQELQSKIKRKALNAAYVVGVGVFMMFTLWEQNPGYEMSYAGNKVTWEAEDAFFQDVEKVMDEDDKVFQLPYVPFPEAEYQNNMGPLAHYNGFFHTDKLRWSYGTMPESDTDSWYRSTAALSVDDMIESVTEKGYDGVYINRTGYTESEWQTLESQFSQKLGAEPIVSEDGKLSFFKLR